MNPAFSGDPNRPEFQPGTTNFMSLAGGGDPGVSGGDPTQLAATRAQREAERQARGTAHRATLAQRPGVPTTPGPAGPRPTPTGGAMYYMGGNIGNSAPGREQNPAWRPPGMQESDRGTYGDWRAQMAERYPWMADTSILWGGGPQGYLPIDYQAQNLRYYRDNQGSLAHARRVPGQPYNPPPLPPPLAPWEHAYMQDQWTQNIDPSQAGYWDPQRLQNDPNYNPRG